MKKFIGLLLVLCLFNFLSGLGGGGGADQPDFPLIYIDEGVGGTHVGSLANPYDDFADINWDGGGDNDVSVAVAANEDVIIHLMEGDEWREQLTVGTSGSAAHPITIKSYGSDVDPIINGSDLVATWSEDSAEIFANALDTGDANHLDNARAVLLNADLSTSGTSVRVHFSAATGGAWTILGASIGVRDGASSSFTGVPTRLLFSTAATKAIAAGNTAWSDWVSFTLNSALDHLVHMYSSNDDGLDNTKYKAGAGTNWYREDTGDDDTMEVDMTGAETSTASFPSILAIEIQTPNVWKATLGTEPIYLVFFDETRGTKQASAAACTSQYDWYWAANVLYTYAAADPDGLYTSPGVEASVRDRGIDIDAADDYITIKDLELIHADASGIKIVGDNVIVQDCNISWNYNGVQFWADDTDVTYALIQNCTISNNRKHGIFIGLNPTGPTGVIVEYCTIQDNGISVSLDHGIYLSYADSNTIKYNLISGSSGNGIQMQYGSDSNEFYYNVVYENGAAGIWIGTGDGGDSNTVYNNTFFNNGLEGINIGTNSDSNLIKNNIVYQDADVVGDDSSPCLKVVTNGWSDNTFDNNCYFYANQSGHQPILDNSASNWMDLAEWQAKAGSPDPNAIDLDPKFIDAANDDFRLLMASPCVDAGTNVGLIEDYLGIKIRHAPDIGAYENQTNVLFMTRLLEYLKERK